MLRQFVKVIISRKRVPLDISINRFENSEFWNYFDTHPSDDTQCAKVEDEVVEVLVFRSLDHSLEGAIRQDYINVVYVGSQQFLVNTRSMSGGHHRSYNIYMRQGGEIHESHVS